MSTIKTVLVTGASSGIGYALAKRFADEGHQVVAIARNQEGLEQLARECEAPVKIMVCDLAESNAVDQVLVFLKTNDIQVDILVNNAGVGLWGAFVSNDIGDVTKMIRLQMDTMLLLTHALLPDMMARNRGNILNVASVYSFTPVPYQSIYAAVKAFMYSFTLSLREEVAGSGVGVTLLCPGSTITNFRNKLPHQGKINFTYMTADEVADLAYQGCLKNQKVVIPGLFNKVCVKLVKYLPLSFLMYIVYKMRGMKVNGS